MTFDPSKVDPAAKARLIELGSEYSSDDTLAQSDATLKALEDYSAPVGSHGFGADQVSLLTDVRDGISTESVQRNEARADKKQTNAALLDAMFVGKSARFSGRSGLNTARLTLELQGNTDAVRAIDKALNGTRVAGSSAKTLQEQLRQLRDAIAKPDIHAAVPDADNLQAMLESRAAALGVARRNKAPNPYGTPAETDRLDLLDGLAVELVRAARKAARAASRDLGEPAIADAFELRHLYQSTGRHTSAQTDGGGSGN